MRERKQQEFANLGLLFLINILGGPRWLSGGAVEWSIYLDHSTLCGPRGVRIQLSATFLQQKNWLQIAMTCVWPEGDNDSGLTLGLIADEGQETEQIIMS